MRRRFGFLAAVTMVTALALPGAVAAANVEVVAARVIGVHGTLLVASSNNMTVYTFDKDVANSGVSNCSGPCLEHWPALTVNAGDTPTGGQGVGGTLGTITRADNGALQVTYDGLPLYFFVKDAAPGDANGIYPGWKAVVLAAEVVPTPTPRTTAPATSTLPARQAPTRGGDPLPLLLLAAAAAFGVLAATRRLATARQ